MLNLRLSFIGFTEPTTLMLGQIICLLLLTMHTALPILHQ